MDAISFLMVFKKTDFAIDVFKRLAKDSKGYWLEDREDCLVIDYPKISKERVEDILTFFDVLKEPRFKLIYWKVY